MGLVLDPSSILALKALFLGLRMFLDPCEVGIKQMFLSKMCTSTASLSFLLESGGARRPSLRTKCFKQLGPSQDSSLLELDDFLDLYVLCIKIKKKYQLGRFVSYPIEVLPDIMERVSDGVYFCEELFEHLIQLFCNESLSHSNSPCEHS